LAKLYYKNEKQRHVWIDQFSEMMLAKGIDPIISALKKLPKQQKQQPKEKP